MVALLYLLPALAVAILLLARRYVGERRLLAFLARRKPEPRPRACSMWRSAPRARVPRGGLLIACSMAVRPPPSLLVAP